ALVEAKRLLIEIAKQMEGFNAHVSPSDSPFEKRPKILEAVSVNVSLRVALRVIYYIVNVFLLQSGVRRERIGKEFRAGRDLIFDVFLQTGAANVSHNAQLDS